MTLISFIGLTYYSISRYETLNRQNTSLQTVLGQTRNKVSRLVSDNNESTMYNKRADKIIYRRINNNTTSDDDRALDELGVDKQLDNSTEKITVPLSIDELNIRRINLEKDFDFSFSLVNTGVRHEKQSGFVFLIVSNDTTFPETFLSYPQTDIVERKPSNYTKGIPFSISYMKKINGRILQPAIGEKYNRINILVYSEDGRILLEKSFYIERTLNNNPYEH